GHAGGAFNRVNRYAHQERCRDPDNLAQQRRGRLQPPQRQRSLRLGLVPVASRILVPGVLTLGRVLDTPLRETVRKPTTRPVGRAREEESMEERVLSALVDQVKAESVSCRRFVCIRVGLGLTAPMAAQMLASAGVAHAQPKWTANPTKRGGGGLVKALWWQAPTLLNPHFANGTKD